ncbi:hypothetical protein R5W23_005679 [Gemmata sp. JC673]|uniref:Prenyltransferase n=1 Tax=Gemmata algarum TaxID=2975278 RepID=A0ABU5EUB6_9BACT|nr:hypothetical protein [Gemmata algarum]MDY3558559.1 hypothetical protein [Gemmata algarum]
MSDGSPITDDHAPPFRWWLLPSWLGLDAPCVALTWTWATGRASGVALHARPAAAMFLVVWFIYLSDRLIDVARCRDWTHATGRLRFGRSARPLFGVCLFVCLTGIVALLGAGLPAEVIERAALVALGVGLHGLLFVIPVLFRTKLPGKEFGVGLFFALGAYACLGEAARTWPLLVSVFLVVTFACLVIAARDADSDRVNDPGGASRWWRTMNRDLLWVGVVLTLAAALTAVGGRAFGLSLAASFAGLTALHRAAHRLSGDAVRALADVLLLTPVPILGAFALL